MLLVPVGLPSVKDAPLATYAGGSKGIPATSPGETQRKLKADSAPGLDYRAYLSRRQSAALFSLARVLVGHGSSVGVAGF